MRQQIEEERENVDVLYAGPSLIRHPLHYRLPPPHRHPEKTKQCPDIAVEGSRREGREGGRKIRKPDVKH